MRSIKLAFLSLALIAVFTACRDESSTLGSNWVSSELKSVITDTCTVKLTTIMADSVNTSNLSSVQVGHYKDKNYGDITAKAFIEYASAYFTAGEDVKYSIDSTTIKIKWTGEFMGDTTQVLPIKMYELKQNITLDDNGYLYNKSPAIQCSTTPLGQFNAYVRPSSTSKQYEYKLPNSLGQKFLDKILDSQGMPTMQNQTYFREYFRGIAFIPETTNNIIPSIARNDSSLVITVYYHGDNNANEQQLQIKPTTPCFSKIIQNKTDSKLAVFDNHPDDNMVVSSKTGNMSFIQSSTGFYTKIEFPFLDGLHVLGETVSITAAKLYIYPVRGTYSDALNPLPTSVSMYSASPDNTTSSQLKNSTGTTAQTGNLSTVSDGDPETKYYEFDLTSFLQTNLFLAPMYRQNLQLTFPSSSINTSCKGILISDQNYDNGNYNYKTKLVIRYTAYNSNK
jgi:hypothetical protein